MGASSVTGISGPGSAENNGMKGPGNGRNQYVPLVSPHIVHANTTALVSGTKVIKLPQPLLGHADKWLVFAQTFGTTGAPTVVTAKANDADGNFAEFTLTGTGTNVVYWFIINRGTASA